MKFLVSTLMVLSFAAFAFAGDGTKGGGGIKRNGMVLTFADANVKVVPNLTPNEIPGYSTLWNSLANIDLIEAYTAFLAKAIMPSSERMYFSISDISEANKKKLLAEYRKIIHIAGSGDELQIVAFTIGKETYLLPEFFALQNDLSKAAILFHEALWVAGAVSLTQVLDAEVRYQNWLAGGGKYNAEFYSSLAKLYRDPAIEIVAAARDDLKNNRLRDFLENMNSANQKHPVLPLEYFTTTNRDKNDQAVLYSKLVQKYPAIELFRALMRNQDFIEAHFLYNSPHPNSARYSYYVQPWDASPGETITTMHILYKDPRGDTKFYYWSEGDVIRISHPKMAPPPEPTPEPEPEPKSFISGELIANFDGSTTILNPRAYHLKKYFQISWDANEARESDYDRPVDTKANAAAVCASLGLPHVVNSDHDRARSYDQIVILRADGKNVRAYRQGYTVLSSVTCSK